MIAFCIMRHVQDNPKISSPQHVGLDLLRRYITLVLMPVEERHEERNSNLDRV